ncbi:hypothetical protein [Nocardia sp. NBC_01327]|uniref:hypothetical protein n=1 Tax=Nocardia sp. NBC_01327 TaxID=2903593 RepID=UPI002E0E5B9B|nr:hypothetical protein OG326_24855 [Nocardia sp. NBC_01327]
MSIESDKTKNEAAVENSGYEGEAAVHDRHAATDANTLIDPDSVTDEPNADESYRTTYSDRIAADDGTGQLGEERRLDDSGQEFGRQRGVDDSTQRLSEQSDFSDNTRQPSDQLGVADSTGQLSEQRGLDDGTGQAAGGQSDLRQLREQWREVQTMFVDDPRDAVTRADGLISGTIQGFTDTYTQRRQALEKGWSGDDSADTEQLRQALRGYRDLFDQLMTASAGGATNM